jgi:DNA-binding protein WhiA
LESGNSLDSENGGNISTGMEADRKVCCKKSYLRGAFLAGGSISDPEKTYHLEIICHSAALARKINGLLVDFGLNGKIIKRKNNYVVYLKEGENIVDFLNIIGAHNALLKLENIRILKDMRNNVNRLVNCETANLGKTINASVRQVENIKYIRDNLGFSSLPKNLREIAELRLQYTDANLKELGEMLSPALGKSGVNHRLRRLDKIADDLRHSKGGAIDG